VWMLSLGNVFRQSEAQGRDLRFPFPGTHKHLGLQGLLQKFPRLHLGEWNYLHRDLLFACDEKRVPQGTSESFELNRHDISVLQFYALPEA
jgi:hypothetical protein